jgi:hypothetical protein
MTEPITIDLTARIIKVLPPMSLNSLYSRLKEKFAEKEMMDYDVPMEAADVKQSGAFPAPEFYLVSYRMINGWKLDMSGVKYNGIVGEETIMRRGDQVYSDFPSGQSSLIIIIK